jgi:hypothetical protein
MGILRPGRISSMGRAGQMASCDDYSAADMEAIRVLTRAAIETDKVLRQIAYQIAAERGITLSQPQSEPRKRGQWRYGSIERVERGVVMATAVNDATGRVKHWRITKDADGNLEMEELDP